MNLHPPLTAFPPALLGVVLLLEIFSLWKRYPKVRAAISINLWLAALFVVLAFLSGYQARELAGGVATAVEEHIEEHHFFGRLLLFAIFPCAILHLAWERAIYAKRAFGMAYAIFFLMCVTLVTLTGLEGGELVFEYGVGVAAQQSQPGG